MNAKKNEYKRHPFPFALSNTQKQRTNKIPSAKAAKAWHTGKNTSAT